MAENGPEVIHPGLSDYHTLELILPLVGALSLAVTPRLVERTGLPKPANAILAGIVVGFVAYLLGSMLDLDDLAGKAVVVGLLHAEFSVFFTSQKLPSAINIAFFVSMYLFSMLHLS